MDNGWHKPLDEDSIDNEKHLLHGVIHCNGYGHLLCVNGIEEGDVNWDERWFCWSKEVCWA